MRVKENNGIHFGISQGIVVLWAILPWAMLFSKAALSIILGLFTLGIVVSWWGFGRRFDFPRMKPYLLIYGIVFISGFWSDNSQRWLHLLNVSLPIIVFPLSYFQFEDVLLKHRKSIFNHIVWASVAVAIYGFLYFFLFTEANIAKVRTGGSLPLPHDHIRSSMIVAVATLWCVHQYVQLEKSTVLAKIFGGMALFLCVFLHFLAARTGIMVFYFGLVLWILLDTRQRVFWKKKGAWLLALVLVLGLGFFPLLKAKWTYWMEDIANFQSYSWSFYSDAVRFRTMLMGWEIGWSHPLFGVGAGDVLDTMILKYQTDYNIYLTKVIHNQYLTWFAGGGFLGLGMAFYAIYLMGYRLIKSYKIYFVFFLMVLLSGLVENTLHLYIGETLFVFVTIWATEPSEV